MKGREIAKYIRFILLVLSILTVVSCHNSDKPDSSHTIPRKWMEQWQNPSADLRPLQIVHGTDLRKQAAYLKDSCGLGGVVCNVAWGESYLNSEEAWSRFVDGVRSMRDNDLRVWIYDEEGYPSLAAGGRVLEGHPELESLEMVYDKGNTPEFYSRPSFEFTHASNNYGAVRRYPNPLDIRATERFIDVTHEAYLEHLGAELYAEVEAFFTDEPSLLAVNLGPLGEEVRNRVRVQDAIDPTKRPLQAIPWVEGLAEAYSQKYNEELTPHLLSLFEGDSQKDKEIRQRYWALVGDVFTSSYINAIQDWCEDRRTEHQNRGPVSSGHGLREESVLMHVPVDGNKMQALAGLDIPGLDYLNADPASWTRTDEEFLGGWQAAALPTSVAQLTGRRLVFCETGDFLQTLSGEGPATLEEMQSGSAWQMAWGVTEFALYYTISYGEEFPYRNESTHKAYCDFIGRVNSIVREAKPVRNTLLYNPIYDMQREYQPTVSPAGFKTQNEKVEQIESSFNRLGVSLSMAQIPFVLVDYLFLGKAKISDKGSISIGDQEYSSLVIPRGVILPPNIEVLVEEMKENGIEVLWPDQDLTVDELIAELDPLEKIIPERNQIAFGKFTRSGRDIYLLVNSGTEAYKGQLTVLQKGGWSVLDPQTGEIAHINSSRANDKHTLPVNLDPKQTLLLISDSFGFSSTSQL
ncbi:MAG: hypothetical protein ABFS28_12245 [Bacteroidota bacterium]